MRDFPGRNFALLLCLVGSALIARPILAQAPAPRDRVWLGGGIGTGGAGSGPLRGLALTVGLSLTYQPGSILVSSRAASIWNPIRGDLIGDIGLLVGLGTRGRRGHLSLAAGPALVGGNLRVFGRKSKSFSSRPGAAFQAQALGLPFESIGLGLTGFANLNSRQSFGGVMLTLAIGQLR